MPWSQQDTWVWTRLCPWWGHLTSQCWFFPGHGGQGRDPPQRAVWGLSNRDKSFLWQLRPRPTDAATQNNSDYLPVLKLRSPRIKASLGLIPGEHSRGESASLLFQPPEAPASLDVVPFLQLHGRQLSAFRSLFPPICVPTIASPSLTLTLLPPSSKAPSADAESAQVIPSQDPELQHLSELLLPC